MKKILVPIVFFLAISGAGAWVLMSHEDETLSIPSPTLATPTPIALPPSPVIMKEKLSDIRLTPKGISGYIKKVYKTDGKIYLDFDYAAMFFGDEASGAMEEDDNCYEFEVGKKSCSPISGYYMRNSATTTESLLISPDTKITVLGGCFTLTERKKTPEQFLVGYNDTTPCAKSGDAPLKVSSWAPYWITKNEIGTITSISEQFVP